MPKTLLSKRFRLWVLLFVLACLPACDGSEPKEPPDLRPGPPVSPPLRVERPALGLPEGEPSDAVRFAYFLSLLEGGDVDQIRWASEQLAFDPRGAAPALGEMLSRNVTMNPLLAQNILEVFGTVVPGRGQVEAITEATRSKDGLLRYTSAPALGNTGAEGAIPVLLDMLSDPNWRVATEALRAIERLGFQSGFNGLIGRFPDRMNISAASEALQVLQEVLPPEKLEPILLTAFEGEEPALLFSASLSLLNLDRETWLPRVRDKLAPLLDSSFRLNALNVLAQGLDPVILPGLVSDAVSPDLGAALMAIQLLKHYGSKEAVDALWKATRSDNDDIRRQAWIALTGSGQDKAYARLEALLGSDAPRDRTIAAEVLAGRPEHPSGPLLAASLEKEREFVVARKLATAIALIDYREGADAITGLLGRETRTSPFQAVDASAASNSLLKLASLPPSTVEILLALASSENEAIRVHTARVLGRTCSGPRVREALMTLLRDPSVHVRDQALASWLALDEGTVDVLVSTYAVETDPDMLKRMRKVILQLYHRWPR